MVQTNLYRHSGQFVLGSTILATVAAAAGGSVLAAAYAAVILYIPFAGVITFVLSIGFGILLGITTSVGLRWAKVRHEGIAFLSSAIAALSAFYVSWVTWTWLVLRESEVAGEVAALLPEPRLVWGLVGEINAVGAWSLGGLTPTGPVLWVLWGAEALLILVPAVLLPLGVLSVPFCERCDVWCDATEDVVRFADCDAGELKRRVETKEPGFLEWLERLGAPGSRDDAWIRADLHDCPSCGNLHTLSLKAVSVSAGDDGERRESELEVVNQLLLTTEEVHRLRASAPADGPHSPPETG